MKNVVLCFLTVLMFAPNAVLSAGVSRSTVKSETNNVESARVASPVRTGTRSAGRGDTGRTDAVRSEKNAARGADVASRRVKNTPDSGSSRNINTNSVGARTSTNVRNVSTVKQRAGTRRLGAVVSTGNGRNENVERSVADRAATKSKEKKINAEDIAAAKEVLEQTASLNKSCQEQYNECMDQFCAVVDTNQKRCSCSANLSNYADVESAVTKANNELNNVAQRIRYVGLSADEIRAIMTETEAEEALDGKKDTSETRSMLTKIESLIKDPTTKVDTASESDFGLDLDLDFDFSEDSADIFSLDFLNGNGDSISKKRGTALYNAAKKRCKTILNNCADVGATSDMITGNYDLAIDKDCIAYEQGLKKMNQTLQSNVRSAGLMLQKARLAVLQDKNQYDPKGCVSALETCMTDDMVCGDNYKKCLDPTKRYIDENGNVVLGQDITNIADFMDKFNNGLINGALLETASGVTLDVNSCKTTNNDGSCIIKYLLTKIGTGATTKDGGLCRSVLDKCQQYTYNASGEKYNPYNEIVVNYIQRAMVNIKSNQQKIISDYASSCMTEVAACYNQQVSQVNSWSSVASVSSIKGVMTGACRNVALTCSYAVFANMCTMGMVNATNWVLQQSIGNYLNNYSSVSDLPGYSSGGSQSQQPGTNSLLDDYARVDNIIYKWNTGTFQWEQKYTCFGACTYASQNVLTTATSQNMPANACAIINNSLYEWDNINNQWNGVMNSNYMGEFTSVADLPQVPQADTYATVGDDIYQWDGTSWQRNQCTPCNASHQDACIEGISEIFYQSLLCPTDSTYDITCSRGESRGGSIYTWVIINRGIEGCVNKQCRCNSGYTSWNGSCLVQCPSDQYRNEYGTCTTCSNTLGDGSSTINYNTTNLKITPILEHKTCQ